MGAPGFDNAPIWNSRAGVAPKGLTLVYPYYENPNFLAFQLGRWAGLPPSIRDRIRIHIIDDGSPSVPAISVLNGQVWPLHIRLFRIDVDVRWNWLAARNIGMYYAQGWCVLTDMDHVVPVETLTSLIYDGHDDGVIYRFSRQEHTGAKIHPHPNSMFMTQKMFWKVGGYDESLSGFYGTDGDWRRRCAATAPVYTLTHHLVRYEYQGDSSTSRYQRKQLVDAGKKAIIKSRAKGWKPKILSFPYHEVAL